MKRGLVAALEGAAQALHIAKRGVRELVNGSVGSPGGGTPLYRNQLPGEGVLDACRVAFEPPGPQPGAPAPLLQLLAVLKACAQAEAAPREAHLKAVASYERKLSRLDALAAEAADVRRKEVVLAALARRGGRAPPRRASAATPLLPTPDLPQASKRPKLGFGTSRGAQAAAAARAQAQAHDR